MKSMFSHHGHTRSVEFNVVRFTGLPPSLRIGAYHALFLGSGNRGIHGGNRAGRVDGSAQDLFSSRSGVNQQDLEQHDVRKRKCDRCHGSRYPEV
jgi:hypothetical protein